MRIILIIVGILILLWLCHIARHPKCPECKLGRGYYHGLWPKLICNWCSHEWDPFAPKIRWLLLAGLFLLTSCAQPRYDANGNGTLPQDKLTRWAVHKVNGEGY